MLRPVFYLFLFQREVWQFFQQLQNKVQLHILVHSQPVDEWGVVFNLLFGSSLLTSNSGLDRGAVMVFIQHTTEASEIPPSEEFSYAFRSPLWRGLDNLSCLPADHVGKPCHGWAFTVLNA